MSTKQMISIIFCIFFIAYPVSALSEGDSKEMKSEEVYKQKIAEYKSGMDIPDSNYARECDNALESEWFALVCMANDSSKQQWCQLAIRYVTGRLTEVCPPERVEPHLSRLLDDALYCCAELLEAK